MNSQRLFRFTFLLMISYLVLPNRISGQESPDSAPAVEQKKENYEHKGIKSPDEWLMDFMKMDSLQQTVSYSNNDFHIDPKLDSLKNNAWKNYYEYMSHGYKHRAHVFTWQLTSSIIIFFLVILLVVVGIYFAWLQFRLALKELEKGKEEKLTTDLTVSPKEIKVSSPVLGIIILIISLLFFYLYLIYIYPITEVF